MDRKWAKPHFCSLLIWNVNVIPYPLLQTHCLGQKWVKSGSEVGQTYFRPTFVSLLIQKMGLKQEELECKIHVLGQKWVKSGSEVGQTHFRPIVDSFQPLLIPNVNITPHPPRVPDPILGSK